ncbi:MAG: beta-ketoacyl synthase [Moraxellaceae bacterium]|nr:beta-ketoacyl synthase [Moraxellaceae bacterium]
MARLPVVVGFGGINAAGRSSFHQGYRRLILESLGLAARQRTLDGLGHLMQYGGSVASPDMVRRHTLIRRIEPHYFDVTATPLHHRLMLEPDMLRFRLRKRDLPQTLPAHWHVEPLSDTEVSVCVDSTQEVLIPDAQAFPVTSAGQLPTGFDPGAHYPARQHPRALQMTVFGASDALHSLGRSWDTLRQHLAPDRVAVYASSAHGQLDDWGAGGMMKSAWQGRRNSARQCPLGFAQMPADFINSYILGSTGRTGGVLGACATFLYNLERAVADIRDGRADFALVGAAEAPILPEVMEGYRAMGALGEDQRLLELDAARGINRLDHTRATRPFGYNAGFTIAESAQFVVLASDEFALQHGLPIHGSVPGVFVNADGYKKSISAPGIGNYLCFGKATGLARDLLGDDILRRRTYIHAHGTGTPQNRVTESHVFDTVAGAFGIDNWLVSSVKCYVGHSLGAAAGDQFMAALGAWSAGIIPGIFTLDELAHDVAHRHLRFSQPHVECGQDGMAACLINAKGFGGNNASALLLGPAETKQLLANRHGRRGLTSWQQRQEVVRPLCLAYEERADQGHFDLIYRFGTGVLEASDIQMTTDEVRLPGLARGISLRPEVAYAAYRPGEPTEE